MEDLEDPVEEDMNLEDAFEEDMKVWTCSERIDRLETNREGKITGQPANLG